jgi:hypothetical protein
MMLWTDGRSDGMTRRLWMAGKEPNFLPCKLCDFLEALLNSRIHVKKHLYEEVILSNRMWPITN